MTYRCELSKVLFSSEILGYRQSLSESNDSDLYHGSKSIILNRFETIDEDSIESLSSPSAIIVELSPMFRNTSASSAKTFEEFASCLYNSIMGLSNGYSRVDVICNRYFLSSLKNSNRTGRRTGPVIEFNDDLNIPPRFVDSLLKNNKNKDRLNSYCADKFLEFANENTSPIVFNDTKRELSSLEFITESTHWQ